MEYLSIWDQRNRKFIKRGYRPARFVAEFPRTKKLKILDHSLSQISFSSKLDLNDDRNVVVERDIKKLTTLGFRYETIGNVFSPDPRSIEANTNEEYEVFAHGDPIPGDLNGGKENCAAQKMSCASGEGSNKDCNPGKCIIGKIKKQSSYKWKYTSASLFGDTQTPLEYFVGGKEVIELKTIVRGSYNGIGIDKPASKSTLIYLPPVGYLDRVFSENYFKVFNYTYALDGDDTLAGFVHVEEEFINTVLSQTYKDNPRLNKGKTLASLADFDVEREVLTTIEDILYGLDQVWKKKVISIMEARWDDRFTNQETNRTFITQVFRKLRVLFKNCLQVTKSNLRQGRIKSISDEKTRPIYLRLPGSSTAYRTEEEEIITIGAETDKYKLPISSVDVGTIAVLSDRSAAWQFLPRSIYDEEQRRAYAMSPAYSSRTKEELYSTKDELSWSLVPIDRIPAAPVAKWLLSGVDEFLREKKHDSEEFYYTYLDPTECSVKNLDWLAQHVGLTAPFWNTEWEEKYKRALIKNALGWFDVNTTQEVGGSSYKTIKGEVLEQYPFTEEVWRESADPEVGELDISQIDLSKIPKILYDSYDQTVVNEGYYIRNNGNQASSFTALKTEWNGLMESKGSINTLLFLFSLFQIKAHSASELEIKNQKIEGNNITGTLQVKSGLRGKENIAPILLPTKYTLAQVGSDNDATINVYENQLIAGVTSISTEEKVNNLFLRLPFYYNRNGKTWDLVESITKYWLSGSINSRAQYAFLAADLWQQGDAFFEPEIIDESIDTTAQILTLDGAHYLEAEDSTYILYN
tara:strand:+ start:3021 stop:5438 length:2418 start_codon:yes stop_codon:yes gene_type:complete